jgi:hypothetical protein
MIYDTALVKTISNSLFEMPKVDRFVVDDHLAKSKKLSREIESQRLQKQISLRNEILPDLQKTSFIMTAKDQSHVSQIPQIKTFNDHLVKRSQIERLDEDAALAKEISLNNSLLQIPKVDRFVVDDNIAKSKRLSREIESQHLQNQVSLRNEILPKFNELSPVVMMKDQFRLSQISEMKSFKDHLAKIPDIELLIPDAAFVGAR